MMEGTRLLGVDNVALVKEVVVAQLVAEETARDIDLFAPHNNNLLSGKDLFGNDGGQATKKVTLSIDHDGRRRECGHDSLEGS